jgi:hypothetical protein
MGHNTVSKPHSSSRILSTSNATLQTSSVSFPRRGGGMSVALTKRLNRVGIFVRSPDEGNTFHFETLCFLVFRIPDDGQCPENK